ncbi:sigma-70 family RNA polymerase sigma factor [Halobacillus litoralis]|uniref:RNA polymerase sigma factor n=1 Tax=Halobacillus litoralis TaxID=45668 RepID=UPI001CD2A3C2|nr:sigma-70 family RNA polymerase sigma factor [Halobacillus litoralis]MCA0972453.1 sigma-70 family RNA polymerase sigma factor [Halobacillus litoralis]
MDSSFNNLYTEHYNRVYYAALKMTRDSSLAEDILQETFIKAHDRMDEIKDEAKVGAWLSTIATRKAIDWLRKEKRLVTLPIEELPFKDATLDVEDVVEQRLQIEETFHAISTLPPKLRIVLKLSCLEGKREKEIAEELGLTQACVKSRLYRARAAMKSEAIRVIHTA